MVGPAAFGSYIPKFYPGRRDGDFVEHLGEIKDNLRQPGHWKAFVATTRTSHAPVEALGLTTDVVVAEAARVADEVGFDRLTLAAVAERLGVRLPSLYNHIAGFDELRCRLAVLAVIGLGDAITRAAVGWAGTDALLAVADAYRAWAHAHPGLYPASLRAPEPSDADHMAASDAALVVVRAVLAGYGLKEDDVVDATRALRGALHGFVSLEAAGGFGLPQDVDRSFSRLVTAVDSAIKGWR